VGTSQTRKEERRMVSDSGDRGPDPDLTDDPVDATGRGTTNGIDEVLPESLWAQHFAEPPAEIEP